MIKFLLIFKLLLASICLNESALITTPEDVSSPSNPDEPILALLPNDCATSRNNAKERALKRINDSIWIPECETMNEKLYSERQCHKTEVCWCVDQGTGLPLLSSELTTKNSIDCAEIKKMIDAAASQAQLNISKSQLSFYQASGEYCDAAERTEFVTSLNNLFKRQISDHLKHNPSSTPPAGIKSINVQTLPGIQVSKWRFALMDKDNDGELDDREWSNFKSNFKLIDRAADIEVSLRNHANMPISSQPTIILRSQRRCWRAFLEFCANGNILNDSISLSNWLSCTDFPNRRNKDNDLRRSTTSNINENPYAYSKKAALTRSKKKNPFLGILKPD